MASASKNKLPKLNQQALNPINLGKPAQELGLPQLLNEVAAR